MLTIYFSGTGNTKYIAELFSQEMDAICVSIEEDIDFQDHIKNHDILCFCYPIYGSRVPLIMRRFVAEHMEAIKGKKLIIFATQLLYSGDGARVFTDLFQPGTVEVIYAEHFNLPNNVSNLFFLGENSAEKLEKKRQKAEAKLEQMCRNIKNGISKKRGFSAGSKFLGNLQGLAWQGNSRRIEANSKLGERTMGKAVRIDRDCTMCGLCVKLCPMDNLEQKGGVIAQQDNCTVCYRCVNACPQRAISIYFRAKPKWQYKGMKNATK